MKKEFNLGYFHFVYDNESQELFCTNDDIHITNVEEVNVGNALLYVHELYSNYGSINYDYVELQQLYITDVLKQ